MRVSLRYCRRSQCAICSGDQSASNRPRTIRSNSGSDAGRVGFGRLARSHAAASASVARYASRPPLRAISLETVDGARPIEAAMTRLDKPAAIPRVTSSRCAIVNCCRPRRRGTGRTPPCLARCARTADGFERKDRAMSLLGSPLAHSSHNASSCSLANATRTSGSILYGWCADRLRPPSLSVARPLGHGRRLVVVDRRREDLADGLALVERADAIAPLLEVVVDPVAERLDDLSGCSAAANPRGRRRTPSPPPTSRRRMSAVARARSPWVTLHRSRGQDTGWTSRFGGGLDQRCAPGVESPQSLSPAHGVAP